MRASTPLREMEPTPLDRHRCLNNTLFRAKDWSGSQVKIARTVSSDIYDATNAAKQWHHYARWKMREDFVSMPFQEAPMLGTPMLTSPDLVAVKVCMEAGGPPQPTGNENRTKSFGQKLQQCKRMTTPLQLAVNWASHPKGLCAGRQRERYTMWHSKERPV